jgi:hypothetical protein
VLLAINSRQYKSYSKTMANYRISGVWKQSGVITHYAFHNVTNTEARHIGLAQKIAKAEAIKIVENSANVVTTIVWDYNDPGWRANERVHIVGTGANKYLRSNPDKQVTDNLGHLPNYGLIF